MVPLSELVNLLEGGGAPNGELAITFDDGYEDNFRYAAPILERLELPATFFVVTQWIGTETVAWWDRHLGLRCSWMDWDQLRDLNARGFEIGAHTRTHADLGLVPELEALGEIVGSRQDLEQALQVPVQAFAYPYGRRENLSEQNLQLIRDAGYRCCCSAYGGVNSIGTDPFRLMRVPVVPGYASPEAFGFEVALGRTLLPA